MSYIHDDINIASYADDTTPLFIYFSVYDDKTHYKKKLQKNRKTLRRQINSIPARHDKHFFKNTTKKTHQFS